MDKLYTVSFSNGVIGVFTSLDIIKEKIFDVYSHVSFIIHSFSIDSNEQMIYAWILLYKNTEYIAYVSNNKDKIKKYKNVLNCIGQSYNENIEYWEVEINKIVFCVQGLLESLNNAYKETSLQGIDSSLNIIEY